MKVSRRVLARYIARELINTKDQASVIESLAAYLVENKLTAELELIIMDITDNLSRLGHVEASVTTARPLDASLRQSVIRYIEQLENVKDVNLHEGVDPSLLGGLVIETPTKLFDASVRTKLKRLRNA